MFVKGTLKKAFILLILAVLLFIFGYFLIGFLLFLAIAFLMQFFRDPERKIPQDKGLVVAPADGKILKGRIDRIETVHYDDPLMKDILDEGQKGMRISTFMSPFDVHVNRVPISGMVLKTKYYPGKFKIAMGNVQTENEKNLIVIGSEYGRVGVIQIAGFVARRIVQYVDVGDWVQTGERLGMIKFGSRVDVIVPQENTEILISEGERSTAGETIIARMSRKTNETLINKLQ
jgi:phosphatidylserine decarboxylase